MNRPTEISLFSGDVPLGPLRILTLCGLFLANYFFPFLIVSGGVPFASPAFPWLCLGGTLLFLLTGVQVCASAGPLPKVLGLPRLSGRTILHLFIWGALIFAAGAVAAGAWGAFLTWLRYPVKPQELQLLIRSFPAPGMRIGFFLQVAVVIPAFEELIFRRGIHELLNHWGPFPALIGTAAIFSGVHFHLPGVVTLLLYGIGFQIAYARTRSFLSCWMLHGMVNAISFLLCILI